MTKGLKYLVLKIKSEHLDHTGSDIAKAISLANQQGESRLSDMLVELLEAREELEKKLNEVDRLNKTLGVYLDTLEDDEVEEKPEKDLKDYQLPFARHILGKLMRLGHGKAYCPDPSGWAYKIDGKSVLRKDAYEPTDTWEVCWNGPKLRKLMEEIKSELRFY